MTLPRTPSQTVGPFFALGLCRGREDETAAPEEGSFELIGTVLDGDGVPVPDALVEIWLAAERRWDRCATDSEGRFQFTVSKPRPLDGEAPRIDVYVFARGLLKHQLTRIYFPDERANESDPVLSALDAEQRDALTAKPEDGAFRFDIRLQGDRQTVFFAV
jgi:protocatechuate 3,4-dioxygenase alpha subunit